MVDFCTCVLLVTGVCHSNNFEGAMKFEHNKGPVADRVFVTTNYNVRTTPRQEWDFVVGATSTRTLQESDVKSGRRAVDIQNLLGLEQAVRARLQRAEIIAVVLFTGPMVRVPLT